MKTIAIANLISRSKCEKKDCEQSQHVKNAGMSRYIVWENFVFRKIYSDFLFPLSGDKITLMNIQGEEIDVSANDDCFCGSGKKRKKCHRLVYEGSVVANLWKTMSELDKQLSGFESFCRANCSDCCKEYFYVSGVEYYLIKNHLLTFAPDRFESIKREGIRQYELLQAKYPEERSKFNSPVGKVAAFNDKSVLRRFEPCALLNSETGMCEAYPARTLICRLYGSSSLYEYCDKIRDHIATFGNSERMLAPIKYDENLSLNVDHFKLSDGSLATARPYPLLYWLANDDIYTDAYDIAVSRSIQEYIRLGESSYKKK